MSKLLPTDCARYFAAATALALAGCGSAPLSFVEGMPVTRTDPSLYPVRVISVDGSILFAGPRQPVQISPGVRMMVLEAAPGSGARGPVQRTFAVKIEPCQRYYFAARRESPMASEWSLVEDRKETVAGCDVADELRKAKLAAAK